VEDHEVYAAIGNPQPFFDLVERFYEGVERDPLLRPMYPADLGPGKKHLALFLIQRFGGPTEYDALRGHPRLRMRHRGFAVDVGARDAWLRHMAEAVRAVPSLRAHEAVLMNYFSDAAEFLVNR
jgi:hemoglobin